MIDMHRFSSVLGQSLVFAACVLVPGMAGAADSGPQRLQAFLDGLHTLQAKFEQTLDGGKGANPRRSSGTLVIERPGRFRWDYRTPYVQEILADGETIWMYDPDLAQVTRQSQAQALRGSPAQVLSEERPLTESFQVIDRGRDGDLDWVELRPRDQSSQFEHIALGLDARGLKVLDMSDKLGQHTRIELSQLKRNPKLDPGLFHFDPPPGVDVLSQ